MENLNFEVDEDLSVEEVELEKNRVMADPKHSLHGPYWNSSDPSHKYAIAYVQAHYDRINDLRNPVEPPTSVETPVTRDLDQDQAKSRLAAMKSNPEVRAIFGRGKKHPLYAKTLEEWTALHQAVYDYDQDGGLKKTAKYPDLEEGRIDLPDLPGDVGDQFMEQWEYLDSLIDRSVYFSDIEVAFWDLYEKFGDPCQRVDAEQKV